MTPNRSTFRHAFFFSCATRTLCLLSEPYFNFTPCQCCDSRYCFALGILALDHFAPIGQRINRSFLSHSLCFFEHFRPLDYPRNTNRKAQYLSKGSRLGLDKMDWAISSPKKQIHLWPRSKEDHNCPFESSRKQERQHI